MALYRATQLLLNRIMTGRVPAGAFVTTSPSDQAMLGDPGTTNAPEGRNAIDWRDLINPLTISFALPANLAPVSDSVAISWAGPQPTVRVVVPLDVMGSLAATSLRGGPLFMNRNFELDIPLGDHYGSVVARALVAAGFIATAGALVNAGIPAALNTRLAGLPVREPGV